MEGLNYTVTFRDQFYKNTAIIIVHEGTQHKGTQHKGTQHGGTQHNGIWQNDTHNKI